LSGEHTTLFQTRPGQVPEKERTSMKDVVKAFTPPILLSAIRKIRK
jgi:hypothetical protein